MTEPSDVTLVQNAVHNPGEPRHFMRVVPAGGQRTARVGDTVIASSASATMVKEVGRDIYDAVTYFPRADVDMDALARLDKSTHCPLKGDTEYFDLTVDGETIAEAAWSYVEIIDGLDGAEPLRGLVAFDTSKVEVG